MFQDVESPKFDRLPLRSCSCQAMIGCIVIWVRGSTKSRLHCENPLPLSMVQNESNQVTLFLCFMFCTNRYYKCANQGWTTISSQLEKPNKKFIVKFSPNNSPAAFVYNFLRYCQERTCNPGGCLPIKQGTLQGNCLWWDMITYCKEVSFISFKSIFIMWHTAQQNWF